MESDILSGVVAVEREIRQRLARETTESQNWLEGVRRELEEQARKEEACLRETLSRARQEGSKQAEDKAARIRRKASDEAERLAHLTDESLVKIILRHLRIILPEVD